MPKQIPPEARARASISKYRKSLIAPELPFEQLPAMMHSVDSEGRLVRVSDRWLSTLRYRREDVVGRPSADFLTIESRERARREVLPAFFRTGSCENVEYVMVRGDGQVVDVLLTAVLDDSTDENGPYSVAVLTDVTERRAAERRLASSEATYRRVLEEQSEMVSMCDKDGVLQFVNVAYAAMHGRRPVDLIGRNFFDFVPGGQRAGVKALLRAAEGIPGPIDVENEVVLPDGSTRWFLWTNRAIRDAHGAVEGYHSVGRDIHRRVVAEERVKESEARFRLLAENSNDVIIHLDRNLVRQYVSPACREMFGYEPSELIGGKSGGYAHSDDVGSMSEVRDALLEGRLDQQTVVSRRRHKDGRWVWVETKYRALVDPLTGSRDGILATIRDITERKAAEEALMEAHRRLEALASEDPLTGLANRRRFDERLSEAVDGRSDDVSLIMIDVDHFKRFNDDHGHPAGDRCLKIVAAAIRRASVYPTDTVARIGGEEFALLLPMTSISGALVVAERVRRSVVQCDLAYADNPSVRVTVSVGVSTLSAFADGTVADLVKMADDALYEAKLMGRNRVFSCSRPLS